MAIAGQAEVRNRDVHVRAREVCLRVRGRGCTMNLTTGATAPHYGMGGDRMEVAALADGKVVQ